MAKNTVLLYSMSPGNQECFDFLKFLKNNTATIRMISVKLDKSLTDVVRKKRILKCNVGILTIPKYRLVGVDFEDYTCNESVIGSIRFYHK